MIEVAAFRGSWQELETLMAEALGHPVSITAGNARRARLWIADAKCHWCPVITIWWERPGRCPGAAATLDHLRSRLDPRRQQITRSHQDVRTVLACFDCNHRRGKEELARMPAELLEQRAKLHHLNQDQRRWQRSLLRADLPPSQAC